MIIGEYQPFIWETDRAKSYESFLECYLVWIKKEDPDATFDPYKMFQQEAGEEVYDEKEGPKAIKEIIDFNKFEDKFKCTGMCKTALFYFTRNINIDGPPKETCLHHAKNFMMENAVPFTTSCVLLCILSLLITFFTLCMCEKE